MNNKQKFGLFVGLAAIATGGYIWYKNRPPQFKILSFNNQEKTVKWQYGKIVNLTRAGQEKATYSSSPNSDFYINVASIFNNEQVTGIRFNFLGKDNREPQFIDFD